MLLFLGKRFLVFYFPLPCYRDAFDAELKASILCNWEDEFEVTGSVAILTILALFTNGDGDNLHVVDWIRGCDSSGKVVALSLC